MTSSTDNTTRRDELRKRLRTARGQLEPAVVAEHSQQIASRLYPLLADAKHIAGYLALGREVDITALLTRCQSDNRNTYIPVVIANHQMLFVPYRADTQLVPNQYGILEPAADSDAARDPAILDAVIVPLVGFDRCCNRMGMGGGYYDRAFASKQILTANNTASQKTTAQGKQYPMRRPQLIGVAFDLQMVDDVFADWWDVPLDYIVTQTQVFTRATE